MIFGYNEEPCGKPQGINIHYQTLAAATLRQAAGYSQNKNPLEKKVFWLTEEEKRGHDQPET